MGLTKQDEKALRSFFASPYYRNDFSPYMDLIDNWMSTNEINQKLGEPRPRTKKRLERLKQFGFLELETKSRGVLKDYYWYITPIGLYYIFSTLKDLPHMRKFLSTNEKKAKVFERIEKLVIKDDKKVVYLVKQIRNFVNDYQYHSIKQFILSWLNENFGPSTYMKPLMPGAMWGSLNEEYLWQNKSFLLDKQLKKRKTDSS